MNRSQRSNSSATPTSPGIATKSVSVWLEGKTRRPRGPNSFSPSLSAPGASALLAA